MQIALTSMVRDLDATFPLWCRHHLRLFDRLLLWLDEPGELDSPHLPRDPRIAVSLGSQAESRSIHGRFMIRQDENTNRALDLCRESDIDWLCHLDSDELLHAPSRKALEALFAPGVGQVRFVNHEAWPVWEAENHFAACTVFKLNQRYPVFLAYSNGKSAVRCGPSVTAKGAHIFSGYQGESIVSREIVVLHYPCATYDLWLRKYRHLGDFSDFWWDDPAMPIARSFHLDSRNTYMRCMREGSFAEAESFFRSKVLRPETVPHLERTGMVAIFHPLDESIESPRTGKADR